MPMNEILDCRTQLRSTANTCNADPCVLLATFRNVLLQCALAHPHTHYNAHRCADMTIFAELRARREATTIAARHELRAGAYDLPGAGGRFLREVGIGPYANPSERKGD